MSQFKKGQSGNPKGRPKGSLSEKTKYLQEWGAYFCAAKAQSMFEKFDRLPLSKQCDFYSKIYQHLVPKQTETKVKADVNFSQLSDEQVDNIISQISTEILNDE